jgi:uncharacterized protein
MEARGDLVFEVADLPLEGVDVHGVVGFQRLDIQDDGVFSFPAALEFALTLAPVDDGVLVRGRLSGRVVRVCDRCLEPCEVEVEAPDVCHHFEHAVGSVVDLTDPLREDILLVLPQALLCREDCRGLCPRCGGNRNEAECGCGEADMGGDEDDPWGALDDLVLPDEVRGKRGRGGGTRTGG